MKSKKNLILIMASVSTFAAQGCHVIQAQKKMEANDDGAGTVLFTEVTQKKMPDLAASFVSIEMRCVSKSGVWIDCVQMKGNPFSVVKLSYEGRDISDFSWLRAGVEVAPMFIKPGCTFKSQMSLYSLSTQSLELELKVYLDSNRNGFKLIKKCLTPIMAE